MTHTRTELPPDALALDGGILHYTQAGAGAPLLLIHGSLCDYRYWRWQIPALAEHYHVLAASLRGCWPEPGAHPQAGYRIQAQAQDLIGLLRAQPGGQTAHIVGHSRGAQVAMSLATQAPELCRSLTLADPAFRFDDEPEAAPFYTRTIEQLRAGDIDGALQGFIDTVNGEDTWRRMVGWFKDMARDNAVTLMSQILEANLAVRRQDAAALACPLLLVGGANSPAKYGTRQDRLQQLVPQAQRVRIALAAHGMNLANPRAFNRAILQFAATADARQPATTPLR
ncbi:alpha/beta fold hydrolase [Castellaniella caeni]|uniref:alpha/beta fold hydrolase n=1 Tax=Castellaniella caeni TaxID=266123 RepID=UPI002155B011|nr:alpha/beta hydrolase [Castellaniella caeni]